MKAAFFIGRLAQDVELRVSDSGKSVANTSIAINQGDQPAHFFNLVAFEKTADSMAKYCHKGDSIGVYTDPQQNTWEDKNGTKHRDVNFVVRSWEFAGSKKKQEEEAPFA